MLSEISVIDDDASVRAATDNLLSSHGYLVRTFASAEEFLVSGLWREVACLITDIRMPGISGLELQARLAEEDCRIPIIFITAYGDKGVRTRAMRAGALVFLGKPFDDKILIESVRTALAIGPPENKS